MKYGYVYGGAIGDALLGMHLGRILSANKPGAKLVLLSTRENTFVRELTETIPYVEYRELRKENFFSWLVLVCMVFQTWSTAVYEPSVPMPVWWKLILWATSRRAGNKEVHEQMQGYERNNAARATVLSYSCPTVNLFDTTIKVVEEWGILVREIPRPSLPVPVCEKPAKPYILFHFFAAQYRRSIPVDHGRELLLGVRKEYPALEFVLTCAGGEGERAAHMSAGIENVRVVPDLPAQKLLCMLSQAQLVVGTASGVIHMASQLSVPTIALCNLSDPCWLPSYNKDVVLLYEKKNCTCRGDKTGDCGIETPEGPVFRCIYDIKTERIVVEMKKILHA